MSTSQKVLLVDDHPIFREGIKALISRSKDFEIVAETGSAKEALKLVDSFRPDLVIMDLSLPDGNGISTARDIGERFDKIRVVMMSMHASIDYVTEAFQAGAKGYVVKDSAAETLVAALEVVAKDEYYVDTSLSGKVAEYLMKLTRKEARIRDGRYETLTAREQQVLRMLAEDLSAREVAEKLFISPKTVENHRANIMRKLDLHSTLELVRYAAKLGLIDVDLWKE